MEAGDGQSASESNRQYQNSAHNPFVNNEPSTPSKKQFTFTNILGKIGNAVTGNTSPANAHGAKKRKIGELGKALPSQNSMTD